MSLACRRRVVGLLVVARRARCRRSLSGWRRRDRSVVAVGAAGRRRRRRLRSRRWCCRRSTSSGSARTRCAGCGRSSRSSCWPRWSPPADWAPARRPVTSPWAAAVVVLAVPRPADVRRARGPDRRSRLRPVDQRARRPARRLPAGRPRRLRHVGAALRRALQRSGARRARRATTSTSCVTDEGMVRQVGERPPGRRRRDAPASCSWRATPATSPPEGARTRRLRRRAVDAARAGRARRAAPAEVVAEASRHRPAAERGWPGRRGGRPHRLPDDGARRPATTPPSWRPARLAGAGRATARIELDPATAERFARYAELDERQARYTVGLFELPIEAPTLDRQPGHGAAPGRSGPGPTAPATAATGRSLLPSRRATRRAGPRGTPSRPSPPPGLGPLEQAAEQLDVEDPPAA